MNDARGMQFDPIQGQGYEPFKVGSYAIYNGSWQLTMDS